MKSKVLSKINIFILVWIAIQFLATTAVGRTIVVGDDPSQLNLNWMDGVCYLPIQNVHVGDIIEFNFGAHNVYKMKSKQAYDDCNFAESNAELLSETSPYQYKVTADDAKPFLDDEILTFGENTPSYRSLYFSCSIGAHCLGKQRLRVYVDIDDGKSSTSQQTRNSVLRGSELLREGYPVSKFVLGADDDTCERIQNGEDVPDKNDDEAVAAASSCSEPEKQINDDGKEIWSRSCLSPAFTLTPGGVVNQATIINYPFPTDHRVVLEGRQWEFVQGDLGDLQPTMINQLYVHHILGDVILGNGAENVNKTDEDAAFPYPYGRFTGNEDDIMTFHLIDLRETGDTWMECLECRCRDETTGNYLDIGGTGGDGRVDTGGISCCSNCTSLTSPTIDYRMRYNVSWSELKEDEPVIPVIHMTSDMAKSVGKRVEWDVPHYTNLPESERHPTDPTIQVLEVVGTLNDVFGEPQFGQNPDFESYGIHRCIGHMHIGAIEAWVKLAETDEVICHHEVIYGDDPSRDKGFIKEITVQNFDPPVSIAGDAQVKVITHYNATDLHTGVMGLFTLFISDNSNTLSDSSLGPYVHTEETTLTVEMCAASDCDPSLLPNPEEILLRMTLNSKDRECKDGLLNTQVCTILKICTCEEFLALPAPRVITNGCEADSRFVVPEEYGGTGKSYPIDRFCAKTCGLCDQQTQEVQEIKLKEEIHRTFEKMYKEVCYFATEDCKRFLANLYTCSMQPQHINNDEFVDILDPILREAIVELQPPSFLTEQQHVQGLKRNHEESSLLVLERAKLGNKALHRFNSYSTKEEVPYCDKSNTIITEGTSEEDDKSTSNEANPSSGSAEFHCGYLFSLLLVLIAAYF